MAEEFLWYAQDDNAGTNDFLVTHELTWWGSVASPAYATPIPLTEYNSNTHLELIATPEDACLTDHTNNLRWISGTQVDINESGTVSLSASVPTDAQMPLKITFRLDDPLDTIITDAEFFIFDQSVETDPPGHVAFQCIEQGFTNWVVMSGGSSTPVVLVDQGSAALHSYYIGMSCVLDQTGVQDDIEMKITLTYQ